MTFARVSSDCYIPVLASEPGGDQAVGTVVVSCPRLGRLISTRVEMDAAGFEKLGQNVFRVRCPACGAEHAWTKASAQLVSDPLLLVAEELRGSIVD